MLLAAVFILSCHLMGTTWALDCLDCTRTFSLDSTGTINTDGCSLNSERQYSSCSQLLQIDYYKKNATLIFKPSSDDVLDLSNAPQVMTNKTMIWLNDFQFERTFQILCFHANACTTDTLNQTYANGKLR